MGNKPGDYNENDIQIISELASIVADIVPRRRAEVAFNERAKELQCLYTVTELVRNTALTQDEMMKAVVADLPSAWSNPEITAARITWFGPEFRTKKFKETQWKRSHELKIYGKHAGEIEKYYLEEKPDAEEGPFYNYERKLLNAIADLLEKSTERKFAEVKIAEYADRNKTLFHKTLDLVFMYYFEGNFIDANRNALDLLGYMEREINSVNFAKLPDEPQIKKGFEITGRLKNGISGIEKAEFRLKARNGRYVDV